MSVQPRFILFTPATDEIDDLPSALVDVCNAANVAAAILCTGHDSNENNISRIRDISAALQNTDVALMLEGHAELAVKTNIDGAHLSNREALQSAIRLLKPGRIAGAGGLLSRHDAMTAGEAGADYVLFGDRGTGGTRPTSEAIIERISWWAEIFEVPCAGYAASLNEIEKFARAGADFIALGDVVWKAEGKPVEAIRKASKSLELGRAS